METRTFKNTNSTETTSSKIVELGKVKQITRGASDGQWLDGNTGTNPKRWKK